MQKGITLSNSILASNLKKYIYNQDVDSPNGPIRLFTNNHITCYSYVLEVTPDEYNPVSYYNNPVSPRPYYSEVYY